MPDPVLVVLGMGLVLLGSLLGSLWDYLRRPKRAPEQPPARSPRPAAPRRPLPPEPEVPSRPPIFVDGSNVMHWGGEGASTAPLALVLNRLVDRGYAPQVWFDANVGYKLANRHMGPADLARLLPVPAAAIHLAPSGQPADPLVIEAALARKARLVSNDRFMDWRGQFPGISAKGVLVKGEVKGSRVALTL
jgi:hypothetical protein